MTTVGAPTVTPTRREWAPRGVRAARDKDGLFKVKLSPWAVFGLDTSSRAALHHNGIRHSKVVVSQRNPPLRKIEGRGVSTPDVCQDLFTHGEKVCRKKMLLAYVGRAPTPTLRNMDGAESRCSASHFVASTGLRDNDFHTKGW